MDSKVDYTSSQPVQPLADLQNPLPQQFEISTLNNLGEQVPWRR